MGDRLLFGHNGLQKIQAPLVCLRKINGRAEIHAREEPVGVAAERVIAAGVRADFVAQHGGKPAVRVRGSRRPFGELGMQRVVTGCGVGHHVDEQLLDLARLLDCAPHLPYRGRMVRGGGGPQRLGITGHPVGYAREPPADQCPVVVGVGGHQVEHVAHRLQRRGDHVELADVESRVVQLDLDAEPFPHCGERHDVDVVLRCDAVQLTKRAAGRVCSRGDAVGGVVGDVVIVAEDAQFGCRTRIQRGERSEIVFCQGIDDGGAPTQGPALRRCRTCSGHRSGIRR